MKDEEEKRGKRGYSKKKASPKRIASENSLKTPIS